MSRVGVRLIKLTCHTPLQEAHFVEDSEGRHDGFNAHLR
jgi:hypothetical protein